MFFFQLLGAMVAHRYYILTGNASSILAGAFVRHDVKLDLLRVFWPNSIVVV